MSSSHRMPTCSVWLTAASLLLSIVAGEVFTRDVTFARHLMSTDSVMTCSDSIAVVDTWTFDAGGTITGEAVVSAPTEVDVESWYNGAPNVWIKVIPQPLWAAIRGDPDLSSSEDQSVALDQLVRAQYRGECGLGAYHSILLDATRGATHDNQAGDSEQPAPVNRETRSTSWEWVMDQEATVAIVVQQCTNMSLSLSLTLRLLNPGGVESSAEVLPLLNLYVVAAIGHVLVLCIYCVALWRNREGRVPPRVLLALIAVMVFKTFSSIVSVARYLRLRSSEDQNQQALDETARFITVWADILLVIVVLLLCTGYSTVRKALNLREKQVVGICGIGFTVFRNASWGCELDSNLSGSCDAIILSDSLARFVVVAISFLALLKLIDSLALRLSAPWAMSLAIVRKGDPDAEKPLEPLTRFANTGTLLLLMSFRWPFLMYALIPVFSLIVESTVLKKQTELVKTIIQEFGAIYIFVILGFYFTALRARPRPERQQHRSASACRHGRCADDKCATTQQREQCCSRCVTRAASIVKRAVQCGNVPGTVNVKTCDLFCGASVCVGSFVAWHVTPRACTHRYTTFPFLPQIDTRCPLPLNDQPAQHPPGVRLLCRT
jgi:hypothetical protein